ncbi:hypothetical protein Aduo_005874 [Ancylostoma duodenale]
MEELLKDQKIGDHDAAEVFCEYFNIEKDGNVSRSKDPHGEVHNQNVLRMKRSHDYYEDRFGIPTDILSEGINKAKTICSITYFLVDDDSESEENEVGEKGEKKYVPKIIAVYSKKNYLDHFQTTMERLLQYFPAVGAGEDSSSSVSSILRCGNRLTH